MLVIRVKEIKMLRFKQHSPIEIYKLRLRKGNRNRGFRAQHSIVVGGPYSGCMTRHLQALLQQPPGYTSLSFIVWPRNSGRPSVSQGHMQLINDKSAILAWTVWPKAHTVTKPSRLVMSHFGVFLHCGQPLQCPLVNGKIGRFRFFSFSFLLIYLHI